MTQLVGGELAQVVCFHEAFLSGYTRDDATAQHRTVCLSSPGVCSIHRQLSALWATVVVGLIERYGEDVFNTAVVWLQGAALLAGPLRVLSWRHPGRHRCGSRMMPTARE